ncbi:dephospho-CoA kinase/protein folding accessory domain-containing protein [Paenibacillus konkukensis]|uniref:Dephospho-CoA kinase/protein folding accessory domain-containing protein n=1 Tax=Paenibacillus konkukensis TaxID=2020716 RepID=A0ABY4S104_9BACL|nr:GrpB family protein [Paenibacillus konkukensis]UQZ87104.1 dephospho-CoA kinase/protein folding accessory domain-containing protein [Paenibacillus konkukensis]
MRQTDIRPWTPEWAARYAEAAEFLKSVLGEEAVAVYHIGSTSVPDIGYAKPIVDILVVLRRIEAADACHERLKAYGFEPKGENGIPGRRYFTKGGDRRTHHVHMFEEGHPAVQAHLDFKAYLSAHPQDAAAYGELKLRLAEQFPHDTKLYQEGKQEFVNGLAQKAASWAARSRK